MFTFISAVLICMLWMFCLCCIIFFLKILRIIWLDCCFIDNIEKEHPNPNPNHNPNHNPNPLIIINPNNSIHIATPTD